MPVSLLVRSARNGSTFAEKRIEKFSRVASLFEADRRVFIAAEIEENRERKRVEILLPVEAAEGAEIETDQLLEVGVVAEGAVDVAVRRVRLTDEGRVRVTQLLDVLVVVVVGTVDDRRFSAARTDEVCEGGRH